MKPPIDTSASSVVEYPSAIFSLERHEIYPYDRFAYNLLHVATEALHKKGLPQRIFLSFLEGTADNTWWFFNASIDRLDGNSEGSNGFHISSTPLTPILLFSICHTMGYAMFDEHALAFRDIQKQLVQGLFIGLFQNPENGALGIAEPDVTGKTLQFQFNAE